MPPPPPPSPFHEPRIKKEPLADITSIILGEMTGGASPLRTSEGESEKLRSISPVMADILGGGGAGNFPFPLQEKSSPSVHPSYSSTSGLLDPHESGPLTTPTATNIANTNNDQPGPNPNQTSQIHGPSNNATSTTSSLDTLGGGMRKMVDMVNKLRAAGIEGLGLGLPRIAVVGNQSAGKSSLIEAISGIKVPRYTGTCTRCPLEINLSDIDTPIASLSTSTSASSIPPTQSTWHCKISLRFNKQYIHSSSNNNNRNSNPWVDQDVQQHLFIEVTNKDAVEAALVKAQRAILNPSRRWQEFVGDAGGSDYGARGEEEYEVKFSPNVVCMEISGKGLPNLAFIDLPGVIQTTEAESEDYLIDLVTGLVKEYVREKDCLILLAMTMRDDAVNQSAARLAREMGEDRTIGALTKPDTVCPGEFTQWISILRGHSHRLKHGYFVTKQPSQSQLLSGITHQEARISEETFFSTTEPWATELRDMSDRFGTAALTRYLADELGERIRLRLPGIVRTIKDQADEVQRELDGFPQRTEEMNHFFVVQGLLMKFGNSVGEYIQGGGGGEKNKLQTGLKNLARDLARVIEAGRPRIQWAQTEEEEKSSPPPLPPNSAKRGGDSSTQHGLHAIPLDSEEGLNSHHTSSSPTHNKTPRKRPRPSPSSTDPPPTTTTFTLTQLHRIIDSHSHGQLPDTVSSKAIEYLAQHTLLNWKPKLFHYLDSCQHLLLSIMNTLFTARFQPYLKTPLYSQAHDIVNNFLTSAFKKETEIVMARIYMLEQSQIATADEKTFKEAKARHFERLLEARQRNREEQRDAKRRRLMMDTMSPRKRQIEEKRLADEEREAIAGGRSCDPFANEIELMAGTRAYYDLARRRFVDNVFVSVLGEWIGGIGKGLQEQLWMGLGFGEGDVHEKAKMLLEEDPEKERRRRGLEVKREQLRKAMEELNRL